MEYFGDEVHAMLTSSKNKKLAFVLLALIWVVANMVWLGCVSAPLPSGKRPIVFRKNSDFDFVLNTKANARLNQEEVILKLGQPDAYFPKLKIACYKIDSKTRREVMLFLFLIPIDVYQYQKYDLALIEYDEASISERVAIVTQHDSGNFESTARLAVDNWVRSANGR